MKLSEFEWAIEELLKDKNYVYKSLTKDLYFLGKVLERKYRILRVTYTIFMIGMIISVLAFGIALKRNGAEIEDVLPEEAIPSAYLNLKDVDESGTAYVKD